MSKIPEEEWERRITTAYAWISRVARLPQGSDRWEVQGLRDYVRQRLGLSSDGQVDYVVDVLKDMGLVAYKQGRRHYVALGRTLTQQEIMASVKVVQKSRSH